MILLSASRLNVYDGFRFTIEPSDGSPAVTADPDAAAEILFDLGVANPSRLVTHVRNWGAVEILEHIPRRH